MSTKFTPELWLTATQAEMYAGAELVTETAADLIAQSGFTSAQHSGTRILDIGTGLGQLVEAVMASYTGALGDFEITAGDLDPDGSLIPALEARISAKGWREVVKVEKMDVMALPAVDGYFDYAFGSMLYMALPQPVLALKETIRTLKAGGRLGFTTSAHSGPFYLLQLAQTLIPAFPNTRTAEPSPMYANGLWHDPTFIRTTLEGLGMEDIKIEPRLYTVEAECPIALAKALWPAAKSIAGMLGGGESSRIEGWKLFGKMEEALRLEFGDGPAKTSFVALIVTASKPK